LIAHDGTYLGKITWNRLDSDSIGNEIGSYGSPISHTSIFNEIGAYGSQISSQSPFNELALNPPAIVLDGKVIGYLTVNAFHTNAVNTWVVVAYVRS